MVKSDIFLSIVAPLYNESAGLERFHHSLLKVLQQTVHGTYEVIYCDDGSVDQTAALVKRWHESNSNVKLIKLSRNFGKEIATTAGVHAALGEAIITIDADGQHPVELIPEFIRQWKEGANVVVGVRTSNPSQSFFKKLGSKVFYVLLNRLTGLKLLPGTTDFRLIDRRVAYEFKRMTERNRITRGLVDWLGYDQAAIYFEANTRIAGKPGQSFRKLFKLAADSFIANTISPLYIAAYVGAAVLLISTLLGLFMLGNFALGDPANLHAKGSAYVIMLMLFLIGMVLCSQGIVGLYLSHIYTETQNRPLYIVDEELL